MRLAWTLVLAAVAMAAPCAPSLAQAADGLRTSMSSRPLPPGVAALVARAATCQHLAGESGGDGSARDAEVNAALRDARCDTLDRDVAAARRTHAAHRAALDALDAALAP